MKIAGHTMGTPEYSLEQAIELFKDLDFDGIEIVVQDGYKCGFDEQIDENRVAKIAELVKACGLQVSCLTPYFTNINSLIEEERLKNIIGIEKVIQMAALCTAPFVRIYGGQFGDNEYSYEVEMEQKLVDSMRLVGDIAKRHNVTLVIENHFHTMTTSAVRTVNIIKKINHPNVGILYDQANLAFLRAESFDVAISLQSEFIRYVHVKDLVYKAGNREFKSDQVSHVNEEDRITTSKILGEGILPWPRIIEGLQQIKFDGWLSLEYERRWAPNDLPDAKIGMRKSLIYLKSILNDCVGIKA